MKSKLLLGLFLIASGVRAQHSTLRFSEEPINLNQQSVLLIPFERHMYLSDVNRELAKANNLNSDQILTRFTQAIDQSILFAFQEKCQVSSFYLLDDDESKADLRYVFQNRKLEYELVSKTEEQSKSEKLKARFKKKRDDSYQGASIQNGQVVSKRDDRERYMKAVVEKQQLFDSLSQKFNNKFFLFVNQLDIRTVYGDAIAMQNMNYSREIKLHYTLYHKNGEILSTGISRTEFPATENDINVIIKSRFPILAGQIYEELFPKEEESKNSKFDSKR